MTTKLGPSPPDYLSFRRPGEARLLRTAVTTPPIALVIILLRSAAIVLHMASVVTARSWGITVDHNGLSTQNPKRCAKSHLDPSTTLLHPRVQAPLPPTPEAAKIRSSSDILFTSTKIDHELANEVNDTATLVM